MSAGGSATPEADVDIRAAGRDDAAAIHALLSELAEATGQTDKFTSSADDLLAHGFSDTPAFEVLIAERGRDILGMTLFFYTYSSWRGQLGTYVQDIVVRRAARGAGIGRLLLRATARHAAAHGATHLRLSVERDNDQAIAFYRAEALHACASERLFQADGAAFAALAGKR